MSDPCRTCGLNCVQATKMPIPDDCPLPEQQLKQQLAKAERQSDELVEAMRYTDRTGLDNFYHGMTEAEVLNECAARMSAFGEHGWATWLRRKAKQEETALSSVKGDDNA